MTERMGYERKPVHFNYHNQRPEAYGCKFKSKQERKWADYLEILKKLGAIESWEYEPKTFDCRFSYRKQRIYTPDFKVVEPPEKEDISEIVWHEVKTSLRQKDVTRFKFFKAAHPKEIIVLVLNSEPKRSVKQAILLDKAQKYVDRVIYAGPIFRKYGIK